MRERVADFRVRSGLMYAPAMTVPGARPLAADEHCPTLFRYPGPVALHEMLARGLTALAPPGAAVLWLSDAPQSSVSAAVAAFGSLVVLEPLRLSPQVLTEGASRSYVAAASPVDAHAVVWLPPSRLAIELTTWDAIRSASQARAVLGDTDDERQTVLERLGAYVEELAMLAAAGAASPGRPWIDVPAEERARVLGNHGLIARYAP